MFTLAHLSDLHLSPPAIGWHATASKRFFGYLSYHLKRKKVHDEAVLTALVNDLRRITPDHIAITGDLTTIALPEEFERVRHWLRNLSPPDALTVVPGNHDAYVAVPWSESLSRWAEFMSDAGAPMRSTADFPFVRRRGPVALVGVSSAFPSPLFQATGRIGADQLAALAQRLEQLAHEGCFRVVLVHHPLAAGAVVRRKRLIDRAALCAVIERAGAELILHGHDHRFSLTQLATPRGAVPVIGATSASARRGVGGEHATYHLYRLEAREGGWRLEVEVRELAESLDKFACERRFSMSIPLSPLNDDFGVTEGRRRQA